MPRAIPAEPVAAAYRPRGYLPRRKPRWGTLVLIVTGHVLALLGLARVFASHFTARAIETATSLVTVTISAPPEPKPSPAPKPQPSQGGAADQGKKAVPRAVTAPKAPLPRPSAAPRAASTGSANQAGAAAAGSGTGAGGQGQGSGSGAAGTGTGGLAVSKPVKVAGDIRSAADYPAPPGGRQARFGQAVTIAMTVGTDGRATNCRVIRPSSDPVADRITCQLAVARFRFRPATDAGGNPVAATYGWRQRFFQAR
ncbi:MAG: TonB family protein [Croceibacterium sp.]